ncbi:MAG: hypothetical protein ACLQSR_15215 [Limisphaerales bacterium]
MIENVLSNIGGIGLYGIISICIFGTIFLVAFIWMLGLKKPYLHSMSELPLEDEPSEAKAITDQPHERHE